LEFRRKRYPHAGREDVEEFFMARIIVHCKNTGHYLFTAINTDRVPTISGGCVLCPFCRAEHVWTIEPAGGNDKPKNAPKLIVRQA
jgi:hypothetical protein